MGIHFTKMHGTGNDYVYINAFEEKVEDAAALAVRVSDRHFGVGSDGLILIAPSGTADCRMIMYNADGSEGAMCGNGIRCVAKYAYEHGIVSKPRISIETKSGVRELALTVEDEKVTYVQVNMGRGELCCPAFDGGGGKLQRHLRIDGKSPLCDLYVRYRPARSGENWSNV